MVLVFKRGNGLARKRKHEERKPKLFKVDKEYNLAEYGAGISSKESLENSEHRESEVDLNKKEIEDKRIKEVIDDKISDILEYIISSDKREIDELLTGFENTKKQELKEDVSKLRHLTMTWISGETKGEKNSLRDINDLLREMQTKKAFKKSELHRFGWILKDIQNNRERLTIILKGILPLLLQKNYNPEDVKRRLELLERDRLLSEHQFKSLMKSLPKIEIDDFISTIKATKIGMGQRFLPVDITSRNDSVENNDDNSDDEDNISAYNDDNDKESIDSVSTNNEENGMTIVRPKCAPQSSISSIINDTNENPSIAPSKVACFNTSTQECHDDDSMSVVEKATTDGKKMKYDHSVSRIPGTDKKKWPQRKCVHCRQKYGFRNDTRYKCMSCNVALCKEPCFNDYHCNK